MSPELAFLQALNGISFGALLFILAAGLSLIFGMMDVVNLAHGAFYMLGAYVALSVVRTTGSFWVALVITDLIRLKPDWGAEVRTLPPPDALAGSIAILGNDYPVYRLFVIAFGVTLALSLAAIHRRSRGGALIRAGVDDAQMLSALGVDTDRLFAVTYAVGAALAGLAGVVAAPVLGLQPGMDVEALVLSLIVVVVGGLGTLGGAQV